MMVGFQRLETVFRDATDPILIEDLAGVVLDLNDEAIRTYGFAREELIGQPIKMIVPQDRHGQADDLLSRCRAGELVRDIEGVRVTKEGHEIPVLLSLSLLHDDCGKACAIATFAKDISRLKSAENKLRQLTRVYRDAANPILLEDLNGIVFDLNVAAERLYGWTRGELIGRPIKTIIPSSRHGQADEILARCIAAEEIRNVEGLRQTKDGTVIPVLITLSLLKDDAGNPTSITSFAKEITAVRVSKQCCRPLTGPIVCERLRRRSLSGRPASLP